MKAGDLVFVREKGFMSSAIRLFDPGRFNHVAIAVSDTEIIEAEYNTRVRITELNYDDYEIVSLNLTSMQRQKIIDIAPHYVGRWYDYLQILGYLIRARIGSPKALICSELAHDMLKDIGIKIGDRFTKPNELYRLVIQYALTA